MKKFILLFVCAITVPIHALCSIEEGESICTIQNSNPSSSPLFQNNNIKQNANENNIPGKSSSLNTSFGQQQNKSGIQMNSSLGCQFGNCNKSSKTDFLNNQ